MGISPLSHVGWEWGKGGPVPKKRLREDGPAKPTDDPPGPPAPGMSISLPSYLSPPLSSSQFPIILLPKYFHPLSPPISHLVFMPFFHTLLPNFHFSNDPCPGWGRSLFLTCCVTLKSFLALSVPLPSPAGASWSLNERHQGGKRQAKGLNMGLGSSSALCPGSPHQPQSCAGSLQQERDRLLSLSNWAGS